MKIPAFKLVHGVAYPLYVLDFVRCPDGIYAVVVYREPRTTNEQIPQPLALSQVVIDRDWIVEPVVEKVPEKVEKPKKVLNESETKTTPKTTKSTKSTTTKSTTKADK